MQSYPNLNDTIYWNANFIFFRSIHKLVCRTCACTWFPYHSSKHSLLREIRDERWRVAHDGSLSIHRFAIALKYSAHFFVLSLEAGIKKIKGKNGNEWYVFAHCTVDSIIRSILIRKAFACNTKKVGMRKRERGKNYGGYLNGVDLWMLRLLTMPICRDCIVYSARWKNSTTSKVEMKSRNESEQLVWLCLACM